MNTYIHIYYIVEQFLNKYGSCTNNSGLLCNLNPHSVKTMKIAKITWQSMIRMKSGVQLKPHCSGICYRTQFDALFGKTLFAIMPRLTGWEKSNSFTGHTQSKLTCNLVWMFGPHCDTMSCDTLTGYRKSYVTPREPSNQICAMVTLLPPKLLVTPYLLGTPKLRTRLRDVNLVGIGVVSLGRILNWSKCHFVE